MMHGLIFLWLNVCLFVTASVIARRLMWQHSDNLLHVVSTGVVACSAIVLSIMALGIPGRLTTTNLTILWTIIALLAWCWSRKLPQCGNPIVKTSRPIALILTPAWMFSGSIILAVGLLYILSFTRQLLTPPCNLDDLTYHFYFPAIWFQSGTLANPITAFGDLAPTYSPMNTEMLNFWVMHAFRSDLIARVLQHLFLGVCALSIVGITRKLDVPWQPACISGACFAAIPYYLTQGYGFATIQSISNDITTLAFYLVAIYLGLFLRTKPTIGLAVLTGLACGLFLGSKYIAVVFGVPLYFWLIIGTWADRSGRLQRFCAMLLAILATGSFSYIRNWIMTGNPLYPSDFMLGDWKILAGIYNSDYLRSLQYFKQFNWEIFFFRFPGYPRILMIGLCVGYVSSLILIGYRACRDQIRAYPWFLLILPVLNSALFYYGIPHRNDRFMMFSIAPTLIVISLLSRRFPVIFWLISGPVIIELIKIGFIQTPSLDRFWTPSILICLVITLCTAGNLLLIRFWLPVMNYIPITRVRRVSHLVLFLILSVLIIPGLVEWDQNIAVDKYYRNTPFSPLWPACEYLMQISQQVSDPLNIACSGLNLNSIFMDRDYKNSVFYVPINDLGYLPHEFDKGSYRNVADPLRWVDNLSEHNIDYLVCMKIRQEEHEDQWARRLKDFFELVFEDSFSRIYRFSDPCPTRSMNGSELENASLAAFDLVTPVICPGCDLQASMIWEVDPGERLTFAVSINGYVIQELRYPSPSMSPRAIYRIRSAITPDLPLGLHPLDVTIRSVSSGETRNVHLGQIDVRDAASIPRPAATQIESPTDGELLTARSRFSWKPTSGTIKYKVSVIMPNGQTADHYVDDPNLDLFWDPESIKDLPAGTYRWHVTAIGAAGTPSDPSKIRSFIVDHF